MNCAWLTDRRYQQPWADGNWTQAWEIEVGRCLSRRPARIAAKTCVVETDERDEKMEIHQLSMSS